MHHHEYKDKVFVLESKESIKRLGKSPDIFDSVMMGLAATIEARGNDDGVGQVYPLYYS